MREDWEKTTTKSALIDKDILAVMGGAANL